MSLIQGPKNTWQTNSGYKWEFYIVYGLNCYLMVICFGFLERPFFSSTNLCILVFLDFYWFPQTFSRALFFLCHISKKIHFLYFQLPIYSSTGVTFTPQMLLQPFWQGQRCFPNRPSQEPTVFFSLPHLMSLTTQIILPFSKHLPFVGLGAIQLLFLIIFLWIFLTCLPLICWLSPKSCCPGSSYKPSLVDGSTLRTLAMTHI